MGLTYSLWAISLFFMATEKQYYHYNSDSSSCLKDLVNQILESIVESQTWTCV